MPSITSWIARLLPPVFQAPFTFELNPYLSTRFQYMSFSIVFHTYPMPWGWLMLAVSATHAYVDGFTDMSVLYGVGRMPSPVVGRNET